MSAKKDDLIDTDVSYTWPPGTTLIDNEFLIQSFVRKALDLDLIADNEKYQDTLRENFSHSGTITLATFFSGTDLTCDTHKDIPVN